MSDFTEQLGANVRDRRAELGITQKTLAMRAGLNPDHVGRIERGEIDPLFLTVVKLAGSLGVPSWDLLSGAEFEPKRRTR